MQNLNSTQRKYLRGLAHHVKPHVQIGKNGLSDEVIASIEQALTANELIKVKFLEFKDSKKELIAEIERRTRSEQAGLIGNIVIIFRQNRDPEKRVISLP
ncbi:MAG: RNA-binding protein [Deltaproteobacteria bacterium ADurb.Bin510]|nr:MAG: RNA-binding protein [Deltaproteobacteria bacterium ADurb.Bin510]